MKEQPNIEELKDYVSLTINGEDEVSASLLKALKSGTHDLPTTISVIAAGIFNQIVESNKNLLALMKAEVLADIVNKVVDLGCDEGIIHSTGNQINKQATTKTLERLARLGVFIVEPHKPSPMLH